MAADVVVVGAGISGLTCARELNRGGLSPLVLEKSRGPGGRCATWRMGGQPVDYGPAFLHGADPGFLAELESFSGATPVPGWPEVILGAGRPCQPEAFNRRQRRLAFVEGLRAWPKRMARGLDIRTGTRVVKLRSCSGGLEAITEDGGSFPARNVVLALPSPQARALLDSLEDGSPGIASARGILEMLGTVPCLTLMATYPAEAPAPGWDMLYPEDSPSLQLISHESAKRAFIDRRAFVLQGHPAWSRKRLEDPRDEWTGEILEEAVRLLGDWAGRPLETRAHVWRFARSDGGSELAGPVLVGAATGALLGLAGESFAPGGGVEAAYLSGYRLAARLLEDREVETS